jgi:hydrogenase nickel incorporation protein HypA/HybF
MRCGTGAPGASPPRGGVLHELNLATEIHRTCRTAIAARGEGRLDSVRVAVGELSAVEPELLVYAWEAVVSGGPDAGARLEVEWHPARQTCARCGDVPHEAGGWLMVCPTCGQPLRVEGGDEMDVIDLTYTPDGEGAPDGAEKTT